MILIIKHVVTEGPGLFGDLLKEFGFSIKTVELSKGQNLPALPEYEGIIIMGGPMNVYETKKYPFLSQEVKLIKQALVKEIPLIGICLGAQLLAKACGAKVYKAKKEIGWFDVFLTDVAKSDLLFKGIQRKMSVFQWHEDTFDLPVGACLVARGGSVANQAVRFGPYAWGIQFHPEITAHIIYVWTEDAQELIDRDVLIDWYFHGQEVYMRQASVLCRNFSEIIRQHKAAVLTAG